MTTKIDTWDSTMSREDTNALTVAADIEFEKGNEEAGYAILKKIPLSPEMAMCLMTQAGIDLDVVKNSGLNFKDVEKRYGTGWLERLGN